MKYTDKQISVFSGISKGAGIFTLVIAITMIFSLLQLKVMKPLDNSALIQLKEQFDSNPDDIRKAEDIRTLDLMARKAYFSSRWQVETGSYLLLAGAIIFIFFQRLVAGSEKPYKALRADKPDIVKEKIESKRYILISAGSLTLLAVISSFILRSELPSPGRSSSAGMTEKASSSSGENSPSGDINYPFFRGEGSRGVAGGKNYPEEWDAGTGKNIKWKSAVPKPGKNSPVIWDDKLFLTGAGDGKCEVYCYDKNSGELLWTASASDFPEASVDEPESDAEAGLAVPTAAVDANVICAVFGNGNLICLDHKGKLKWARNIGVPETTYGYSASLLIFENILLVQYDSETKISLTGYDTGSGEIKFETQRNGRAVNSSPVLAWFDNAPQVIINGNPNVTAYSPVTGKELWSQPGVSGDVAPSLAANDALVYATTDYYKLLALKPGLSTAPVWEDNTYTPDVSSPVATNEYLFIATGYGDVACYNAAKGDTLWAHYFDDTFYASPIVCDGKVWFLGRSGTMHIAEAGNKFKLVSQSPLGENSDCTPAFSESKIFIRGRNNLYCISD